ncbi:MAG: hypothetical protein J6Q48_05925 [Bacteroidaceae bacterium]|nr:hypothetical protein [Bacteroidaceae bacterium]
MNVLIACEESQRVCTAFRARGHEAFSCDILPPSGGHPEWHIQGDVLPIINGCCEFYTLDGKRHVLLREWDLIIAHPPCTYLSNAGACRLYKVIDGKTYILRDRFEKGLDAKDFFLKLLLAMCDKIAVENPIPSAVYRLPDYSQIIQPYEYGHPYTKKTCLWLKGLPKLRPTEIVKPIGGYVCGNSEIWKKQAARGEVIGREKSPKHRSKTFEGIAKAMAEQWG